MSTLTKSLMRIEQVEEVTLVTLLKEKIIDESMVQLFGKECYRLVDEGSRKMVIDFRRVRFFGAAAPGKLITLNKKLLNAGGRMLALCSLSPQIYETFVITGLVRVFTIREDVEAALASFQ